MFSSSFFFFNDTATTEIYTLSLHDALPILDDMIDTAGTIVAAAERLIEAGASEVWAAATHGVLSDPATDRSEEHTSELQSQSNLVCRLLLEKKKNQL